jgi:uncharacterized iron-regulated membrane protein
MTPFLAQTLVVLVMLITLMVLLLMGYLFWLQRQERAEPPKRCSAPTVIRATRQRPPMKSSTR